METERLSFRRIVDGDLDALWALWSDPRVQEGLINRPQTRDAFVPLFETMRDLDTIWAVCDRTSGTIIGRCGFYQFGEERTPELAYLLGSAWWGKGLATEMGRAALRNAEAQSWTRVVALILPDNAQSLAVARRLGFVYERDVAVRGRIAQLHARTTSTASKS